MPIDRNIMSYLAIWYHKMFGKCDVKNVPTLSDYLHLWLMPMYCWSNFDWLQWSSDEIVSSKWISMGRLTSSGRGDSVYTQPFSQDSKSRNLKQANWKLTKINRFYFLDKKKHNCQALFCWARTWQMFCFLITNVYRSVTDATTGRAWVLQSFHQIAGLMVKRANVIQGDEHH